MALASTRAGGEMRQLVVFGVFGIVLVGCPDRSDDGPTGSGETGGDTGTETGGHTGTETGTEGPDCAEGDPITVVVYDTRLNYVDAEVTATTPAGTVSCDREVGVYDTWTCAADPVGDATVEVSHPLYLAVEEVVPATDGCRAGGEEVDVTMEPTGTHFDDSRMYYHQRFADPYECENSWAIHGVGCYYTAAFCADGYSAIFLTDILNLGVYDVGASAITNTTVGVSDIESPTSLTMVSDTELAWLDLPWVLDQDGLFELVDCPE
jgi:hypothetical protein